jgi:hypothetical protein
VHQAGRKTDDRDWEDEGSQAADEEFPRGGAFVYSLSSRLPLSELLAGLWDPTEALEPVKHSGSFILNLKHSTDVIVCGIKFTRYGSDRGRGPRSP